MLMQRLQLAFEMMNVFILRLVLTMQTTDIPTKFDLSPLCFSQCCKDPSLKRGGT